MMLDPLGYFGAVPPVQDEHERMQEIAVDFEQDAMQQIPLSSPSNFQEALAISQDQSESLSTTESTFNKLHIRGQLYEKGLFSNNIGVIRNLAFQGIAESTSMPEMRALYWKILLGYISTDSSTWASEQAIKRQNYRQLHLEIITDPHRSTSSVGKVESLGPTVSAATDLTTSRQEVEDHPLSNDSGSVWKSFFADKDLTSQISLDVERTHPDLHFFHEGGAEETVHHKALKRILHLYAKTNPRVQYVQGMNEILAPIYYVFAKCSAKAGPDEISDAEADSFWCFAAMMGEIGDRFCRQMDGLHIGVKGLIAHIRELLREADPHLCAHLDRLKINPQFYGLRWTTLLLSQELELPDIIRLWDSLFSAPNRFHFLEYVCCAMLMHIRDELLQNDFGGCMRLLQRYPSVDVAVLLAKAVKLLHAIPPRQS